MRQEEPNPSRNGWRFFSSNIRHAKSTTEHEFGEIEWNGECSHHLGSFRKACCVKHISTDVAMHTDQRQG